MVNMQSMMILLISLLAAIMIILYWVKKIKLSQSEVIFNTIFVLSVFSTGCFMAVQTFHVAISIQKYLFVRQFVPAIISSSHIFIFIFGLSFPICFGLMKCLFQNVWVGTVFRNMKISIMAFICAAVAGYITRFMYFHPVLDILILSAFGAYRYYDKISIGFAKRIEVAGKN